MLHALVELVTQGQLQQIAGQHHPVQASIEGIPEGQTLQLLREPHLAGLGLTVGYSQIIIRFPYICPVELANFKIFLGYTVMLCPIRGQSPKWHGFCGNPSFRHGEIHGFGVLWQWELNGCTVYDYHLVI